MFTIFISYSATAMCSLTIFVSQPATRSPGMLEEMRDAANCFCRTEAWSMNIGLYFHVQRCNLLARMEL